MRFAEVLHDDHAEFDPESEARAEELNAEITETTQKLDEEQARQLENTRAIMKVSKNAERYLTKRQTLITRKDECTNAIRDLGILPEEAYTTNVTTSVDRVSPAFIPLFLRSIVAD